MRYSAIALTSVLLAAVCPARAGVILVDLNRTYSDPITSDWNTIESTPDNTSGGVITVVDQPLHSSLELPTPATLSLTGAWAVSMTTGNASISPDAPAEFETAARDYFWISTLQTTSTLTIGGLIDGSAYQIEVVSSRASDNTNRSADFSIHGSPADDPAGFSTPHHDGQDFHAYDDGYLDGMIMEWSSVQPIGGEITLLAAPTAENNTAFVNALRITGPFGLPGDLDFDGNVTFVEAATVVGNISLTGATWTEGDFDANGVVDVSDAQAAVGNLPQSPGAARLQSMIIPEPAALAMVSLTMAMLLARRRSA